MLAEGISVAAGGGQRYRGQYVHIFDGDGLRAIEVALLNGEIPGLDEGRQFIPIIQEHIHRIGNVGMDQLKVIEQPVDQRGQLFMLIFQVRD